MKQILKLWMISALMLMVACQQQGDMEILEEPVELTFQLNLEPIRSRADAELVDGQKIQNLSVYLWDTNKQLAAKQENISVANQAQTVVNFDGSYRLQKGSYQLVAVANHSTPWEFTDYQTLMAKTINTSGTDNVSPKDVIQPLSLMKDVELRAGTNDIQGELVRTFARFRLEVKNNSGEIPLRVNALTFSNNFTQTRAYVFDDGTDKKYTSMPVAAPVITSAHALTPFVKDEGKNYKTIPNREGAVLFDAYFLESKAANGYTYRLDLAYVGGDGQTATYKQVGDAINKGNKLSVDDSGSLFLFSFVNSGKTYYLNAGADNKVGFSELAANNMDNLGPHCVWKVIPVGDNRYQVMNMGTGQYLQQLVYDSSVVLGTTPVNYMFYSGNSNLYLYNNYCYVNCSPTSNQVVAKYYTSVTNLTLHPVQSGSSSTGGVNISHSETIELKTIDPVSQQASLATAIKRNDYINVLVTVSYNSVAGNFDFQVENWSNGGGDVEFN